MSDPSGMYQPLLLEHHRNPHNTGSLQTPSHQARVNNPLCGDRVDVSLLMEGAALREVRCETKGCALCRASGSLMTLALAGLLTPQILNLCKTVELSMAVPFEAEGGPVVAPLLPGNLAVFLPVRSAPSRVGCITLPWQAVVAALNGP